MITVKSLQKSDVTKSLAEKQQDTCMGEICTCHRLQNIEER